MSARVYGTNYRLTEGGFVFVLLILGGLYYDICLLPEDALALWLDGCTVLFY